MIPVIFIILIIQAIENKTIEQKTFNDLQEKIDNFFDAELILDSDYTFDPSKDKTTGIIIKRPLIIEGQGFKINGLNQARIFEIYNSNVTFKRVFFINGFSKEFGGAINLFNSSLELIICNFTSNSANIKGGAINLNNSYLNIYDSYIKSNNAKGKYGNGGGIASENSIIKINISHFVENLADEGGAIYSINSTLDIYGSLLYNNSANWYGGALVSDSQISIRNSALYNNIAGYKGGAIHTTFSYLTDNCFLYINFSTIYNNSAEYGGAISSSNKQYVHIFNSNMHDNHALFGAVVSRMSDNDIQIINSSCYNNFANNGSILYSVAGGNNSFINNDFKNNKADVGGIIYTISGRYLNEVTNFSSTFIYCNLADNYGKIGLIYTIFDDLIITNSSITYMNKSYDIPIIYKIAGGKVIENRNWWGEKNPNLDKLIYYEYYNIINNKILDKKNLRSDGCSSTVIQIDDNNWAFTFRRDSSASVYVNIVYQKDGILQYKTDPDFFWHTIINKDGWIIANGGLDYPHSCEKLEAYGKIMIKQNIIIDEFIENALKIKYIHSLGHYFIKSPNGTYALVSYIKSKNTVIIEKGKLKSGEYIICPNNYDFYQKGKISDLNIKGNYTYISRYLAAIDEYSSQRTNEFTYNYITKENLKYIDIFISNDDGSLSNKPNTSNYYNDIYINSKYILGEKVPIIMDGMYLDRFIISNKKEIPNKDEIANLKMNIKLLLLFIWLLFL